MSVLIPALLVVALIAVIVWRSKRKWQVLREDVHPGEELFQQFGYLKNKGIRCKIAREQLTAGSMNAGFVSAGGFSSHEKIKLLVHKEDLGQANQLLESWQAPKGFNL